MMKISPEISSILKVLRENQRFLITSHRDPDGDSVGSQMGLYHVLEDIGKEVIVVNHGAMPEKYLFLDPRHIIKFVDSPLAFVPEAVFVLECPSLDRIGFVEKHIPDSAVVVNIDHHLDNKGYGAINYIDPKSCAVGELIYLILECGGYEITPIIAEKLYAALVSDTGNFRFSSTTARGMKIAAELVEKGARPKWVFDNVFSKLSSETLRLLGYTLETLKVVADGRISYMLVTRENISRSQARLEDSEGFVDYSLAVKGAIMGILFKEIGENEVKISVRSQNGIDAAKFAKRFDGGGHINAAGFTLNGKLSQVVDVVLALAGEAVVGS
jgi:phosphoesterase RecJ-like protein